MNKKAPARLFYLLWLAALVLLVGVWLLPISNRLTRGSGAALCLVVWFSLFALCWHRSTVRRWLCGLTLLMAAFVALPARGLPDADSLRADYVAAMRHYEGVPYYWGGESPKGIDCSGLIRRGLIDSLFCRGIRRCDPGLVRYSLTLWWNDCTAKALGEADNGTTVALFEAPSLNELDHTKLLVGDLAVTRNGVHILAYIGQNTWIQADPTAGRVICEPAPSHDNGWFLTPMKLVRWSILAH